MADIKEIKIESGVYQLKDAYSRKRLHPLQRNKKIVFIGDSYLEGYSSSGTFKSWGSYVGEDLQAISVMKYEGGTGFAKAGQKGNTFTGLLKQVTDKTQVTDIVVCGGYNDKDASESDILAGVKEFVQYANTNFVDANIYIGFIGYAKNITDTKPFNRAKSAYATAAGANGVTYLSGCSDVMHNYNYYADNIHPNDIGHRQIAYSIVRAMTGGVGDYFMSDFVSVPITPVSGMTIQNPVMYQRIQNGLVFTYCMINKINLGTGTIRTGLDPDQKIKIGTYNPQLLRGNEFVFMQAPMACFNEGTAYNGTMRIILDQGNVYIHIDPCKSNGWITGVIGDVFTLKTSCITPLFYE